MKKIILSFLCLSGLLNLNAQVESAVTTYKIENNKIVKVETSNSNSNLTTKTIDLTIQSLNKSIEDIQKKINELYATRKTIEGLEKTLKSNKLKNAN